MTKYETRLTSVNILNDVYRKFKINTVDGNINLQKIVNRSLDLYNSDVEFRKTIDNHSNLTQNNSKF